MSDEAPPVPPPPATEPAPAVIEPPAPLPAPAALRPPLQVGRAVVALLLWLWVGVAFAAYLSRFEPLALPILKALGAS